MFQVYKLLTHRLENLAASTNMNLQQWVIRPEPHVFDDFQEEKFEQAVVVSDEPTSLKRMTAAQSSRVYITERVDYPEFGMLMKYKDVPYLRQGFVFPEAMDSVNNLKRITVLFLAILKGKPGRGMIKGRIETALAHFCWIADWMFGFYDPNSKKFRHIYLKENRYRQSVRELIKLINNFLEYLSLEVEADGSGGKRNFGRAIGTMIEYDNAYHWRLEDICSEINTEDLSKNPRKEITRLVKIYKQREKSHIEFKAEAIEKALNWLLLVPWIRKAFIKAIQSVDIRKMAMTKNDSYFTMNYDGYNFQGKPLEERQKIWLEMTNGKIPERAFIPQQ